MSEEKELKIERKARGVLPSRLSELENDLEFITRKDLEKIVIRGESGEYEGLETEQTRVIVDNLYKTIKVELIKSLSDELSEILPKTGDKPEDGMYFLRAIVEDGVPLFTFSRDWQQLSIVYYYGNVSATAETITEEQIKSLSNGGTVKGNREYTYSTYKQNQVFAYPASYGQLTRIEHLQTGFNVIDLFNLVEMVVGGVVYYVYISKTLSTGEYTYRFIY